MWMQVLCRIGLYSCSCVPKWADPLRPPSQARSNPMKNQLNALLLTAALSGLVGGTTLAAQGANQSTAKVKVTAAKAGLRYTGQDRLPNTLVKARTVVRARAAASPAITAARERTAAPARAAARQTGPLLPRPSKLQFPPVARLRVGLDFLPPRHRRGRFIGPAIHGWIQVSKASCRG